MRFVMRAAMLLALLLAPATAATPPAAHVRHVETRVIEGRTVTTTIDQDGTRRLVRRCEGPVCGGSWFDGDHLWSFGINGILVPESQADIALERTRAATPLSAPAAIDAPLTTPHENMPVLAASVNIPWPAENTAVIVPCRLHQRPVRCLIDTGTSPSAIILPLADALGLEPRGELEMTGSRRILTGLVETGPLVLGNARWEQFGFAVIPRFNALPFDVIVGNDALAGLRLTLDRSQRIVRLDAGGAPASGASMPLHFMRGLPYIDGALGGQRESWLLDTGDTALFSVGYDRFRRGGIRATGVPDAARRAESIGGSTDAFPAEASAQLGDFDFGTVPVRINRAQSGGHVGVGLAERCRLTIDQPARRLECERGAPSR